MKKKQKSPKKSVAASKLKKPAPAKKPAKPVAKPLKAKAPEKKAPMKAVAPAPTKKVAAPAPVHGKKVPAPLPSKGGKKELQEKVVMGKKDATNRPGAVAAAKPQPIKVEPKIIESPEPEFKIRDQDQHLFTAEELDSFRALLVTERNKILAKARRAMEEGNIQIDKNEMFDEVDQASAMVEQNLTFRLLDRDRKLLSEIDHAVAKIDSGDYGYCEGTGEPIPKRRLELRPWCRHSVKYKEKLERMKKSGRGVVDEDEV